MTAFNSTAIGVAPPTLQNSMGGIITLSIIFAALGGVVIMFRGKSVINEVEEITLETPEYDRDFNPSDYNCKKSKHAFKKVILRQGNKEEIKWKCVLCGKMDYVGDTW